MRVYFEIKRWSRLGNWMFQYATARSISNDVVCLVEHQELIPAMKKFRWFADLDFVTEMPLGAYVFQEHGFGYQRISYPSGTKNLVLKGWFQSQKYFKDEVVRRLFACDSETEQRLRQAYATELSHPNVTSIHVRRGDYLTLPESFPFVGSGYLKAAVKTVIARTECNDIPFIVLSDDISWCRSFFTGKRFGGLRFRFSSSTSPLEDMALASFCKNNIISNSSFGWWGAWLNSHADKKVFAPVPWLGVMYKKENAARIADFYDAIEPVCIPHNWFHDFRGYANWMRKNTRIRLGAIKQKIFESMSLCK